MKFFFIILFFVFYSFLLKAECTKGVCTNGTGVYEFDNGDKYIGQFNNSEYDGKGTFRFSSGDVYTGNFKNGKYSGLGVYQYSNGSIYSGGYLNGSKNGYGNIKFQSGNEYEGEFKNGTYNGYGEFKFTNGDTYAGEWLDGEYNGIGTFTYSDGEIKFGIFENNKLVQEINEKKIDEKNENSESLLDAKDFDKILVNFLDSFLIYEKIIFHNKNSFTIFNLNIDDEMLIGELSVENFNDNYINNFNNYNGQLFDKFIIKDYSIKNNSDDHSVEYIELEKVDIKDIKILNKFFLEYIVNEDVNSLNLNEIINLLDGMSVKTFNLKNAKIIEEGYEAYWDNFEITNFENSSIGSMLVKNMYIEEDNEIIKGNFVMKDLVFARPSEHNIDLQLINFLEDPQYVLSFLKKIELLEFTDYYYNNKLDDIEVFYDDFVISDFITKKINNLNIPVSINISSNSFEVNALNQYANSLDYDKISLGFNLKFLWNTDKNISNTNLEITMNKEIKISSEFSVNNLNTKIITENSDFFSLLNQLMIEPKFDYFEITVRELGFVSRLINSYSRSMNMTNLELIKYLDSLIYNEINKFPEQYGALKDQDIEKIINFINYPNIIKFSVNPNPDLSFGDISVLNLDLSTFIKKLNFKIH